MRSTRECSIAVCTQAYPRRMPHEDQFFIRSSGLAHQQGAFKNACAEAQQAVLAAIDAMSDADVLQRDHDQWSRELADEARLEAPTADPTGLVLKDEGRVDVDCTGAAGVTYSMSEYGRGVIRPGKRLRATVPCTGPAAFLLTQRNYVQRDPQMEVTEAGVARVWDWPRVKTAETFQLNVEEFRRDVTDRAEWVAAEVERSNASLAELALKRLGERRKEALDESEFLGALNMPLQRDPETPPPAVGTARPKATPARRLKASGVTSTPGAAPGSPGLDELYEHVLDVVRAVGRGMERSPGSFKGVDEPVLRDHMLVTLNTHYEGRAHGESFNRNGKTDILVRVENENVFIGECKWWDGPESLRKALSQLFGYSTWRDSRVALIFYVDRKNMADVVDKARTELESHEEFVRWEAPPRENEMRCRVRWPEDGRREATLTAVFFHVI